MQAADQLAYIAHFIVIPADSLNQLLVTVGDDPSLSSVVQRTVTGADDVSANDLIFGVAEAFVGGGLHSCVDFFDGDLLAQNGNQFSDGAGEGRNAFGATIQLLFQPEQHQSDCFSCVGAVGYNVYRCSTCTATVDLWVRTIL